MTPSDNSVIETSLDQATLQAQGRVAFPRLSEQQTQQIAKIAKQRLYQDGEPLWQVGDREASFFVVLEGAVDIRVPLPGGSTNSIVKHGPGGFTGDIDLLSSKAAVVAGIASGETRVLEVCPVTLKKLVVANPEVSDVVLAAFITRRRLLMAQNHGEVTLLGSRYSPQLYALREFLERNSRPFGWIDVEANPEAENMANGFQLRIDELPAVITATGHVCRNPSVAALAEALGLSDLGGDEIFDMAVVGGGPAGLAAAVYGGSEGLNTIVLDAHAPGGQAATSSKIENYLGFPMGVSGSELAQNALTQAEKFGVRFATPRRVAKLVEDGPVYCLQLDEGAQIKARTVVAASGVRYRRLPASNAERFEGQGIYFAATFMEAELCADQEIAIVGGGNSAGQAAVFLAKRAKKVHILIRSGGLEHSMSRYLINRIDDLDNVQLRRHTEITCFNGDQRLGSIDVRNNQTDQHEQLPVSHVFVFIGAVANTEWLAGIVELDRNGFVYTGESSAGGAQVPATAGHGSVFETGRTGVFAVGDVRCGSTKRVASAVGEGSIVVQFVHQRLAENGPMH